MEITSRIQSYTYILEGMCRIVSLQEHKIQMFSTTSSGFSRRPYKKNGMATLLCFNNYRNSPAIT